MSESPSDSDRRAFLRVVGELESAWNAGDGEAYGALFAPHSKLRAAVTPAHRGVGGEQGSSSRSRQARHPAPRGHDVGAAPEARVRHPDRHLRPLRRDAQGDREHRRAAGDCEDSGASAEDGLGSAASRAAPRRAGAADPGATDVTPGEEIAQHLRRPSGGLGPACARTGCTAAGAGIQAGWWCRADREPGVWSLRTAPEGPEGGNYS